MRDPTSDFAQLAKKGSNVLKFVRDRKDRQTMREKFWEIAGSKMGSVVNHDASISKEALDKEQQVEEQSALKDVSTAGKGEKTDEVDYKADS